MKKRKFKWFVKPVLYGFAFSLMILSIVILNNQENKSTEFSGFVFVNKSILTNLVPVLNEDDVVIRPYTSDKVKIYKKYYDKDSSIEERENAIIYYKETYIQNSGVIYSSDEEFDIVSMLEGEVTNIKEDELLGNIVEITYSNNLIANYEGLKNVTVKVGQKVSQNEILGKSSKINIDESLNNALLLEIIKDGKYINPENYFDKKVKEL